MNIRAIVHRVCITKKIISITLSSPDVDTTTIDETKKIKKQNKEFNISVGSYDYVKFNGTIVSINVRKRFHFVIHLDKETYWQIISKFSWVIDKFITVAFVSEKEKEIKTMLNHIASKAQISEDDLLFRLTSFKNVEGKKSLSELSEKRKDILHSKLKKMISESIANA